MRYCTLIILLFLYGCQTAIQLPPVNNETNETPIIIIEVNETHDFPLNETFVINESVNNSINIFVNESQNVSELTNGSCLGICPPNAPTSGSGSFVYSHNVSISTYGEDIARFWIYEPDSPKPSEAPVIYYFHGWGTFDPNSYNDFLTHLARKGYIVVFINYGSLYNVSYFEQISKEAIEKANLELQNSNHVKPNGKYGFVGHSLGSILLTRLAATNSKPDVMILHDPAGESFVQSQFIYWDLSKEVYSKIDPNTKLLIITAEAALFNGSIFSQYLINNTPITQKNLLMIPHDSHGTPSLYSDHSGVQAYIPELIPLDAIDWWGYWRPTEKALDEALKGEQGNYSAFCNKAGKECDGVRFMGTWSDGKPVNKIKNSADLGIN